MVNNELRKQLRRRGYKINSLDHLEQLAADKRAVFSPLSIHSCYSSPKPARFVLNYSGVILHSLFLSGLYVYEKGGK